ncbi:MAG: hypothetical protein MUC97_19275 [Bernardetiaceae bacterium]|jgi:hypothetical protein|nr:hypothetical protein [Bernardetiaceae bacterium]
MKNLIFAVWLLGLLAAACQPCKPDRNADPSRVRSGLSFELIDRRTGSNIFPLFTNGDRFRVTDAKGEEQILQFGNDAVFDLIDFNEKTPEDLVGLGGEATKVFYLHLSPTDTDTISVSYRLAESKCEGIQIDRSFKSTVRYNGEVSSRGGRYIVYQFYK